MSTNNPFLEIDRQVMGDVYTSTEMMDNLAVLCDDFGSRFGGTEGERQAAEFMRDKLATYGLSNVHLEPVEYLGWRRGEVTFAITSPIQKRIACITLPHSPPADLEGVIIDVDEGALRDFDERAEDIKGKIVLTTSEVHPQGIRRWVHRNEKYGRALLAGATGFIFVNHYPGYGPATGGIGHDGEALIPGISISKEDGAFIQRLLKRRGEVTMRLRSTDVCEPMTSWNVLGELPGTAENAQVVMLGCHYDGHDISQGAADPASGTVAVMEAARLLAQYAGELPHTLRFALWGVEEIGLIGSSQYVDRRQDELDNIRFYLNMDMAGAIDPKDIILNEWQALAPLFRAWSEEMALAFGVGQSVNAHSDHYPFLMAGVPTGGIGSIKAASGGRGYGHTRYDTLDKVEMRSLREAAALATRMALRIASAKDWPALRRSQEAVKALLDSPDYREEVALFASVDAFYKAARSNE